MLYFLDLIIDSDDQIDDIVDDMVELELTNDKDKDFVIKIFGGLIPKWKNISESILLEHFYEDLSKTISSIEYGVSIFQLPNNKYVYDSPIEEYEPENVEYLPVASISLVLNDQVNDEKVTFHANIKRLDELITKLQACQKELRLSESLLKRIK